MKSLERAAAGRAEIVDRGQGHIQIKGVVLVNYYPWSRSKRAYIAGMVAGLVQVSPQKAVEYALDPKQVTDKYEKLWPKVKRKKSYKQIRRKMFRKGIDWCYWCGEKVTYEDSSVDHKIPLSKGGLDNANNRVLTHISCNKEKGDQMPNKRGYDECPK